MEGLPPLGPDQRQRNKKWANKDREAQIAEDGFFIGSPVRYWLGRAAHSFRTLCYTIPSEISFQRLLTYNVVFINEVMLTGRGDKMRLAMAPQDLGGLTRVVERTSFTKRTGACLAGSRYERKH